MAIRVKIAKDKAQFVQSLVQTNENLQGIFPTYADLIAFAASLGVKYKYRLPLEAVAKETSPISLDVFTSRGYDLLIKLLAIAETEEPKIISNSDSELEETKITIFEEYANGGLEKLKEQLKGSVDYTERLLLILTAERFRPKNLNNDFDLSKIL